MGRDYTQCTGVNLLVRVAEGCAPLGRRVGVIAAEIDPGRLAAAATAGVAGVPDALPAAGERNGAAHLSVWGPVRAGHRRGQPVIGADLGANGGAAEPVVDAGALRAAGPVAGGAVGRSVVRRDGRGALVDRGGVAKATGRDVVVAGPSGAGGVSIVVVAPPCCGCAGRPWRLTCSRRRTRGPRGGWWHRR